MTQEAIMAVAGLGLLFMLLGAIGLHRFPDVYMRLHAATKCTTLGAILLTISLMLMTDVITALHAFIVLFVLVITSPAGAHAIARATHRSGIMPMAAVDQLKEARLE